MTLETTLKEPIKIFVKLYHLLYFVQRHVYILYLMLFKICNCAYLLLYRYT